jgi:hypothetical protein
MEAEKSFAYCLMARDSGELTEMPILLEKGSKFIYKDGIEYTVTEVDGTEEEYKVYCVRSYVLKDELYDSIKAFWVALKDIAIKHKSFDNGNIIIKMNNVLKNSISKCNNIKRLLSVKILGDEKAFNVIHQVHINIIIIINIIMMIINRQLVKRYIILQQHG